ncbi:amino acid permease domain-containing protein [Ditylenchus destructor]|nr:amino acid permease domain-containing protein [Ditylenchus destructor]
MAQPLVIDQQIDPADSLFSEQFNANAQDGPWWQKNFLLQQPTLVNAWNGVFPTVIVNIFGIVIFLRMGWVVGTAGVFSSLVIITLCTLFSVITVLSAIGICERCKIQSGGIYFLVSHVLGKRIGGAIGIIYTFGQATATGLVALGFGESMMRIMGVLSSSGTKIISVIVLILLTALNLAGLRFIIRLQMLLMCFLGIAVVDFLLGAIFTRDLDYGINYLTRAKLSENWEPHYEPTNCTIENEEFATKQESFFSVFGVLFANFIGVLCGVNMSQNLANPLKDIAQGELSALGVSYVLCFIFMLLFGAGVDRETLLCDTIVSERMALTKFLFLSGLYVSCLSSIISSSLGTSRVVQGIAAEGLIPPLNFLAEEQTTGDKNPLKATILVTVVAVFFLFVADLNQLAILSAMPFLVTYAFVNYSYVALAMSEDLTSLNDQITTSNTNYGSVHDFQSQQNSSGDVLNNLFPERNASAFDPMFEGGAKPWYSKCINRYISFAAALVHIVVVVFINKWYAFMHLIAFVFLYLYLGSTCPASEQGLSRFSIVHMIQVALQKENFNPQQAATAASFGAGTGPSGLSTSRLNDDNNDYSARKPYHHAQQVGNIE